MCIATNWNESKGEIWQKNKWWNNLNILIRTKNVEFRHKVKNMSGEIYQKMSNLATENALFRQRFPDFSVAALFKSLILIKKLETIFEWNQPYDLWSSLVKNGQFVPDAGFGGSFPRLFVRFEIEKVQMTRNGSLFLCFTNDF